jgi:hypothetical protein
MFVLAVLAGCGDDSSSTGGLTGNGTSSTSTGSSSGGSSGGSGTTTPPTAGTASLKWSEPTANTNGTPLTNLAGYRIYYGQSAKNLSEVVDLNNPATTQYAISSLAAGTWYFAIQSVTASGAASALSDVVSLTIS